MVFVNTGKSEVIEWLRGASATAPTHIAVGSDATAVDKTDTALGTELTREAIGNTFYGADWVSYSIVLDTTQQNGEDVTEFGLLNASSDGDLFQRATHTVISKHSQIEIEYELRIKVLN